jgi:glycosyltransferase involved in cell wall biosynthesis
MNILLINHYAGSTRHGMEYRPYYLAREWVKGGHNVRILAASHSHYRAHQPEMNAAIQEEILDDISYRWYRTPEYSANGIGRVRNIVIFLWKVVMDEKRIVDEFKPDVVIASSTYPMDIWPARRIARRAKAQLIYEVHDLWPLSPIELGNMSRWHPFIVWCQWAEDYAYRYCDKVVSILPKTKTHMVSRGMLPEKFSYIPNGINTEEWETIERLPVDIQAQLAAIKECGLPVVGYTGTHGLANALDVLLDAAKLAVDKFKVVLIGNGPERERLLKRVVDEEISNATLLPAIPKASIPAFLAEIDIAYIGWHESSLYRFGISPNKLMDYMMAEKPIVHSVNAGNDPVAEAGCGLTVTPGDPIAIRSGILELAEMTSEARNKLGKKGQRFVLENQTYPVLAKRFLDVIEGNHHGQ